eukprot:gnl/MRDRNA2_/MRDRNA2_105804_c0_seq1.p1 gnl/MRDRNA2_/MRDRNA2_105804_c0~~gnl/MRDRNA2_/MRDRNA2_105804_c0_seq1.p1  ORF type:complete len:594 (-),score=128.52 gnl/MRDRNA2_/MRDRNA2_105804_c0_seq1:5-1786(-)
MPPAWLSVARRLPAGAILANADARRASHTVINAEPAPEPDLESEVSSRRTSKDASRRGSRAGQQAQPGERNQSSSYEDPPVDNAASYSLVRHEAVPVLPVVGSNVNRSANQNAVSQVPLPQLSSALGSGAQVTPVACTAAFRGLQEELQGTRAELERIHHRCEELECEQEALMGAGHTEEVERLRAQLRVREHGLSKPGPHEVVKVRGELQSAQQRELELEQEKKLLEHELGVTGEVTAERVIKLREELQEVVSRKDAASTRVSSEREEKATALKQARSLRQLYEREQQALKALVGEHPLLERECVRLKEAHQAFLEEKHPEIQQLSVDEMTAAEAQVGELNAAKAELERCRQEISSIKTEGHTLAQASEKTARRSRSTTAASSLLKELLLVREDLGRARGDLGNLRTYTGMTAPPATPTPSSNLNSTSSVASTERGVQTEPQGTPVRVDTEAPVLDATVKTRMSDHVASVAAQGREVACALEKQVSMLEERSASLQNRLTEKTQQGQVDESKAESKLEENEARFRSNLAELQFQWEQEHKARVLEEREAAYWHSKTQTLHSELDSHTHVTALLQRHVESAEALLSSLRQVSA